MKSLLGMVEAHTQKEKTSEPIQDTDGRWCILHHLLGCCLLAQAQRGLHGKLKEKKAGDAVRCFFRYSVFCNLIAGFSPVSCMLLNYFMMLPMVLTGLFICFVLIGNCCGFLIS